MDRRSELLLWLEQRLGHTVGDRALEVQVLKPLVSKTSGLWRGRHAQVLLTTSWDAPLTQEQFRAFREILDCLGPFALGVTAGAEARLDPVCNALEYECGVDPAWVGTFRRNRASSRIRTEASDQLISLLGPLPPAGDHRATAEIALDAAVAPVTARAHNDFKEQIAAGKAGDPVAAVREAARRLAIIGTPSFDAEFLRTCYEGLLARLQRRAEGRPELTLTKQEMLVRLAMTQFATFPEFLPAELAAVSADFEARCHRRAKRTAMASVHWLGTGDCEEAAAEAVMRTRHRLEMSLTDVFLGVVGLNDPVTADDWARKWGGILREEVKGRVSHLFRTRGMPAELDDTVKDPSQAGVEELVLANHREEPEDASFPYAEVLTEVPNLARQMLGGLPSQAAGDVESAVIRWLTDRLPTLTEPALHRGSRGRGNPPVAEVCLAELGTGILPVDYDEPMHRLAPMIALQAIAIAWSQDPDRLLRDCY